MKSEEPSKSWNPINFQIVVMILGFLGYGLSGWASHSSQHSFCGFWPEIIIYARYGFYFHFAAAMLGLCSAPSAPTRTGLVLASVSILTMVIISMLMGPELFLV